MVGIRWEKGIKHTIGVSFYLVPHVKRFVEKIHYLIHIRDIVQNSPQIKMTMVHLPHPEKEIKLKQNKKKEILRSSTRTIVYINCK